MTESNPKPKEMTPAVRRVLRARAHALEPVVLIGDKGLTSTVLAEIELALRVHELIKVRAQADRDDRLRILDEICAGTNASAVQHIGKILVIYRKKPAEATEKSRSTARRPAPRKSSAGGRAPRGREDGKPAERDRNAAFGRPKRPSTAAARRQADGPRGTGRPESRTASPRRAPARPPGRRRTSR